MSKSLGHDGVQPTRQQPTLQVVQRALDENGLAPLITADQRCRASHRHRFGHAVGETDAAGNGQLARMVDQHSRQLIPQLEDLACIGHRHRPGIRRPQRAAVARQQWLPRLRL